MNIKRWLYEFIYRFPFVPIDWVFGATRDLERLAEGALNGRISSGKVITLGCGVGRETIYLAKKGFDVIGLDFSPTAIRRARRRAKAKGVDVSFVVDDLTNIQHIQGTFDLVTDFGALNDLSQKARDLYMVNVLPLTHPGSLYLMFCFNRMLPEDEVKQRFQGEFTIEMIKNAPESGLPTSINIYLMTRI